MDNSRQISQELINTVTDVGLSDNQARVYLAALSTGPTKAAEIARVAGVKRSTVYPVIESLEKLSLMSIQMNGFKRKYVAEPSSRLERLVELRQDRLRQSITQLNALGSPDISTSVIKHVDSLETIKGVYNSMIADIKPKQDYMIFSSGDDLYDLDPDFYEDFFVRRSKLDIRIRALFRKSKLAQKYVGEGKQRYNVESKVFDGSLDFTANLVITPQRLVIHQVLPPTWAVVIENPYIIRMHQVLFESFWESVK